MSQSTQTPGWGPPPTPQPPKPKRQFLVTKIAIGVAAGIALFLVGSGILLAMLLSSGSDKTTTPAPTALPASAFPGTASPMTTPATTPAFNPKPSDITVKVKIVSKDNFGDAGSVITYEPDVTLDSSAFDPDVTYQVTYEIRGGQDGPEIHSFTVAGDSYTYDQETTQTASVNQRLTARVTSVDAVS